LATACVLGTQYENGCQQRNRDSSKQEAGVQVREDTAGGFLELGVQGGGLHQQILGACEDVVRRRAHLEQFRRGCQNFVNRLVYEFIKQGSNFSEIVERIRVIDLGDAEGIIALDHAVQYTTKLAGVTAETVRCLHRTLTTGKHLVNGAHDTFREQRLPLGEGDLFRLSAGINENFHNAIVLSLQ